MTGDLSRTLGDEYVHQMPDSDPVETQEWIDSLDAVVNEQGPDRAKYLVAKLLERAHENNVGIAGAITTPYINTIPPEEEAEFPGDEHIERRIRRFIRWNAAVMVIKANHRSKGIGGHLSTFASSATLYEVGFNHFFRGKGADGKGDHVYMQGHAAPGIYARAYLEGRFDEKHLDNFRFEIDGHGLTSYPHPRLMPDFWEFPTVSMGLGPINSIYHARFNKYLHNRELDDTSKSRVWCFIGDGEVDEPETLGAISLATREGLDNLTWVVNCNLQRLDGPVRGNGQIITELESAFRGAGWNVIKVIWGSGWDALLARRPRGRPDQRDEHHRRRGVPAVQSGERRLRPGALLRQGPSHQGDGRRHERRRDLGAAPGWARLQEGVRGLQGGDRARQRQADGDPGQDDQRMDAGP